MPITAASSANPSLNNPYQGDSGRFSLVISFFFDHHVVQVGQAASRFIISGTMCRLCVAWFNVVNRRLLTKPSLRLLFCLFGMIIGHELNVRWRALTRNSKYVGAKRDIVCIGNSVNVPGSVRGLIPQTALLQHILNIFDSKCKFASQRVINMDFVLYQ